MMKKMLMIFGALVICLSLPAVSEKELIKNLPLQHRVWLTEEVMYIMTSVEKEVFLQLESDLERDTFISAFWKQRNPNPNLPENEFKKEHYRRIAYANNWFGRDTPGPGWRTDMGRIYITLGEPKSIERFENVNEIQPVIIWFYQAMAAFGLPDSFNVVFFKQDGIGDYQLYTPIKFGPAALLRDYKGDRLQYADAYNALAEIQPEVAAVSMALISGEPQGASPSLASERLIKEMIPQTPQRKVKGIYAKNFLKFKGMVEVDYADNFVESSSQLNVFRDPSGYYFIHYLIEPKRLSFEQYQDKFYTTLEISGGISDRSGKMVTQISRKLPIELTESQMQKVKDKLFSFQDVIPIIEGTYRITLILKNFATKEFTSLEKDFSVPAPGKLGFSPLLLANRKAPAEGVSAFKPFLFMGSHLLPSPRNDFLISDDLIVFLQINGLGQDLKDGGCLDFAIFRGEEKVFSQVKNLKEYGSLPSVMETFPLQGYASAYYRLKVTLLNQEKKALLFEESNFYITPQPFLPRPWVVSMPTAAADFSLFSNELGRQYLHTGDLKRAQSLLEEAFRKNPNDTGLGMDYCNLLLARKEYAKIKEIALPLVQKQAKFEFTVILGQACQGLSEFEAAVSFYADYLAHFGANTQVLNASGDCYLQLGNNEEALKAWEESLKLFSQQPRLKEKIAALKGGGK